MIFHDFLTPLAMDFVLNEDTGVWTETPDQAARVTLSRRHETLYRGGTRDSITAAGENLFRRQGTLYHGGTTHSITAAGEILSRRQGRFHHGGRRHPTTAARDTLSRRQERLHHGGTRLIREKSGEIWPPLRFSAGAPGEKTPGI